MGRPEVLERQDLKPGRGIVFVDYLGPLGRPIVRRAASSGRLAVFGEAVAGIRKRAWFQAAVTGGHLREFNYVTFDACEEYWRADDLALDAVEAVYAAMNRAGRVPVAPLVDLYGDQGVEAAFKKALIVRLAEFFRTLVAVKLLSRGGQAVAFFPSAKWEEIRNWADRAGVHWELPAGVALSRSWRNGLAGTVLDWRWFLYLLLLPGWVLCGFRRIASPAVAPESAQVALRVYPADYGFRGEETRGIDWPLDGRQLHGGNTLFVIEKPISAEYRAEFARRQYRCVDISGREAFRCVSRSFLIHEFFSNGLRAWSRLVAAAARTPGMFLEVAARGWLEYLRWTAFLEQQRPRHYVAYNHFPFEHVFRNARLRSVGSLSWYYVHSLHDANAFYSSPPIKSQAEWAYLSYDNHIHWGRRDADYLRGMFGRSRRYCVMGPLWSAHVHSLPKMSELLKSRRAEGAVDAVIALFDASFWPTAQYWKDGAREFFEALLAMLDRPEWSRRVLLYKPKNKVQEMCEVVSPEVAASLARVLAHPRCMLLESDMAPGVVIAEADLTISIAFTSTTVEALGARRRALYFDPGGKFPDSYYDQFPNLVAHDRDALARLCDYWLSLSEADFQKYLDRYLAPEFGGHLDGGAVARVRSALSA